MTAWESLVAKSALSAGTAYDHLLSIRAVLGNVFLSKSSIVVAKQETAIVEPYSTLTGAEIAAHTSDSAAHPFLSIAKQFCTTRTPSVFVLMRSKTSN